MANGVLTPADLRREVAVLARDMHRVNARHDPLFVWVGWAEDVLGDLAEFVHLNQDTPMTEATLEQWFIGRGHYGQERIADPRQRAVILPRLMALAACGVPTPAEMESDYYSGGEPDYSCEPAS